jgi:hypothetical protein
LPAFAAVGVIGVVAVAGLSGGGSTGAAASRTSRPSTAASEPTGTDGNPGGVDGTDPSGTDDNPGAVDDAGTAPVDTGAQVVVDTDQAPADKTTLKSTLHAGSFGSDVKMVQQRLSDLGFWPGKIDGQLGQDTQQAIWAYKKLVMRIPRDQLDGSSTKSSVSNDIWQQMQDPITINPRRLTNSTHVEIYLPEQVMVVFSGNKPSLVAHISSGSDEQWCETLKYNTDEKGQPIDPPRESNECGISHTPGGIFKFYRRYTGDRVGPLGGMYNPVYFNYGIAVHGAQKVPTHPASHGCIRINMDLSAVFPNLVKNGNRVYVWGQDGREPESYTRAERTPPFNQPDPNASTTTSTTSAPSTTASSSTSSAKTTSTTTKVASTTTTTTKSPSTTKAPSTTAEPATTAKPPATTKPESPTTSAKGP